MSENPKLCFACEEGNYREEVKDYLVELPEGDPLTVPDVLVLCCDYCGEETLPPDSSDKIETYIDRHRDTVNNRKYL